MVTCNHVKKLQNWKEMSGQLFTLILFKPVYPKKYRMIYSSQIHMHKPDE